MYSVDLVEGYIKFTGMVRIDGGVGKEKTHEFHLFCAEESVKLRSSSLFVTYIHVNSKILFHQKLMSFDKLIKLS